MNTKIIVVAAVALGIGLGGGYVLADRFQPSSTAHDMSMTMDTMTASLEAKEGAEFDQAFINEMIIHHEGAVAMAEMVVEKSERPELVKLANDIIAAQTIEISLMRRWKTEWFGGADHHAQ